MVKENNIKLILIVDDEPVNLNILQEVLSSENYDLMFATSADKALEIIDNRKPDLILLDIQMPEMDGYQLCQKLKEKKETKSIPVIFVTALNDEIDEAHGFEVGAVDYITKPISPSIVKHRIKNHLKLSAARDAAISLAKLKDQQYHLSEIKLDEAVQELIEAKDEIEKTQLLVIQRLGRAAEYKDNETGLHVIRMSHYSRILALAAGMDKKEANLLLNAAPMHDVGKIGIPDHIMLKPDKLDQEEWTIMKTHPAIGGAIIGNQNSPLLELAKVVAATHHEKWNGKGYPKGLKEEEIPLEGRIVAIADVFDALTTKRPYKEAWSLEKSIEYMKEQSGVQFDPNLIEIFFHEDTFKQILEIRTQFSEEL